MKRIRKYLFLFFLSIIVVHISTPVYGASPNKNLKSQNIFDAIPCLTQCLAVNPFNINCYIRCAQNILPNPVPTLPPTIPGSGDIIQCATSCLSNPNPAVCLTNCASNLPACALSCGIPPDLNCVISNCQQSNTSPSNDNQPPLPNTTQPPISSPNPTLAISECEQEGGYCTQDTVCNPNFEYKGLQKGCPQVPPNNLQGNCCQPIPRSLCSQQGGYCTPDNFCIDGYRYTGEIRSCPRTLSNLTSYCCESLNIPTITPVGQPPPGVTQFLPGPTYPTGSVNPPSGYINCNGNYSVTVQGCKLIFCEWRTVSSNETLCVKPEQCNISVCNQYLASYGPQIAEREAAKEGAYINPGTFSGSCNSVTSLGTACSNPTLGTQSFKLRSREDWQYLMSKVAKEEVSPLVVSNLIQEVRESGIYHPGLQVITIDIQNP